MSQRTKNSPPAKKESAAGGRGHVPRLRFPEFREAGEWVSRIFHEVVTRSFYGTSSSTSDVGTYPVLRMGNMVDGGLDIGNLAFINLDAEEFAKLELKHGDILLNRTNSIDLVGKISLFELDGKYVAASYLVAFRLKTSLINPKFCNYLLNADVYQRKIKELATRAVSQANINPTIFQKRLTVSFPLLPEQRKIADCLASLDEMITLGAQKLDALKAHKKGLMQQLFPAVGETLPKLRFPEFRGAGEWEIRFLGELGENLNSRRVPITEQDRVKGEIPYYGASGIIDYVKDFIFDENLLCVSEDGANLVARTYPIAFSISGKTWVNNHAHVLKFMERSTQLIVENYLNALKLDDFLTGMAQPKLNRAKLDIIPVPLPDFHEQQKIADCLSSLDELITLKAQKLDELKAHKKGLMQQLFPAFDGVKG